MRSYGPRKDPETGEQHMRVSQAHEYTVITTLWRRAIGTGSIECKLLRARTPAKRIVQLHAHYLDAGVPVDHVVQVDDELEEARQAFRLERIIHAASIRPDREETPDASTT